MKSKALAAGADEPRFRDALLRAGAVVLLALVAALVAYLNGS